MSRRVTLAEYNRDQLVLALVYARRHGCTLGAALERIRDAYRATYGHLRG